LSAFFDHVSDFFQENAVQTSLLAPYPGVYRADFRIGSNSEIRPADRDVCIINESSRQSRLPLLQECRKPTPEPHSESAGERCVRLFEGAHRLLRIPGLLDQRFRVPLAPLGNEKIATVNMNSTGQARDRIGH
jgi:hypothetical protein